MDKKLIQNLAILEENVFRDYSTMVSGFIHDLNNPMAVITGQISIIQTLHGMGKLTDEKTMQVADKVMKSTQKIAELVECMRDFYKPFESLEAQTNITKLLNSLHRLSATKIQRNDIDVDFNLNDEEFIAPIIPKTISIIMWNLLNSFLDISSSKNIKLEIESIATHDRLTIHFKFAKDMFRDLPDNFPFVLSSELAQVFGVIVNVESQVVSLNIRRAA